MAKIVFSKLAVNDLSLIHQYISIDSVHYAEMVVDRIIKRVAILENNIRIGKVVREFENETIREIKEGNYRIIYRIENNDLISVARIYHGARLLKEL